ncbi:MAG: histidinol-phosphatase HisJ family protein [Bacteroidales bacterium]
MIKGKVYDNHVHSYFSADSEMLIIDAVKAAAVKGLSGICITDHMDLVQPTHNRDFTFNIYDQQKAINRIISNLSSKDNDFNLPTKDFHLLRGIEVGLQDISKEQNQKLLQENNFDLVIFSQHFMEGTDPYHGHYYNRYDWKQAYENYLITLYNNSKELGDFDIIGHFDYIVRYSPWEKGIAYRDFSDIFDEIFKYLIDNLKTFEINTKTYQYYNGKEPILDINIIKRYKELGGEFISLGSDAHTPDRLGDKFPKYLSLLYNNGIKNTVSYINRQPVVNPIII